MIHILVANLWVTGGLILFGIEVLNTQGLRRTQMILFSFSVIPIVIAGWVTAMLDLPVTLEPFGLLLTAGLLGLAVSIGRFLDVSPVARRTAVEQMRDPMIALDEQNRVVDCNPKARELFGVDETDDWTAIPGEVFFNRFPDQYEQLVNRTAEESELEIELTVDGERRFYAVHMTSLTDSWDNRYGRLVVFHDVTTQRERESEINLMRKVQARVLRHNIRNELGIIRGYTEIVKESADDTEAEQLSVVMDAVNTVESLSEKTRGIDSLIDSEQSPRRIDLTADLRRIVESVREEYPGVTFETEFPSEAPVRELPAIRLVFENLIENAAQHHTASEPLVAVSITRDATETRVDIVDNGPGIPEVELNVIDRGMETPLEHGSGIGLWIVSWIIERASATISFDTGEEGTTVTVRINHSRRS